MEGIGGNGKGGGKGKGPSGFGKGSYSYSRDDDEDDDCHDDCHGDDVGRGKNRSRPNPKPPQGSNSHHETPSQMTQATQETSISMSSSTSSRISALTPLRPRQIPLMLLDARRLADIGAHDSDNDHHSINSGYDRRDLHDRDAAATAASSALVGAAATATAALQQLHHQYQPPASSAPQRQPRQPPAEAAELLRGRRRQVVVLASGSLGTLVGLVVVILPTPALVLLAVWLALTAAALAAARRYLASWWSQQLARDGLGPYLPESLFRLLTTESIHSFMTDDTFILENRHLLLYFLPLPPPALERYVQRLAPRHVQRLHRPGLGHLLGESAMQIILGQERWRRQQLQLQPQEQQQGQSQAPAYDADAEQASSEDSQRQAAPPQRPALEVIIERPSQHSRRLDRDDSDDDDSDLGIDVSADDLLESAISDHEARAMAAALPLRWVDSGSETVRQAPAAQPILNGGGVLSTPAAAGSGMPSSQSPAESALTTPGFVHAGAADPDPPSAAATASADDVFSLAEEYAEEELVLTQAVINAVYDGVWTPLSRYFIAAAEDTAGPVTARLVTYGLGISAVSTALGLFLGMVGYRRGIYRRPTIMQAYPRENTLYTTVMLGIAGTGLTLLAHWQLNRGKKGRSYFYSQFSRRPSRKG